VRRWLFKVAEEGGASRIYIILNALVSLGVGVKVTFAPPCIICMENHE
jgi:hypothetical protein